MLLRRPRRGEYRLRAVAVKCQRDGRFNLCILMGMQLGGILEFAHRASDRLNGVHPMQTDPLSIRKDVIGARKTVYHRPMCGGSGGGAMSDNCIGTSPSSDPNTMPPLESTECKISVSRKPSVESRFSTGST